MMPVPLAARYHGRGNPDALPGLEQLHDIHVRVETVLVVAYTHRANRCSWLHLAPDDDISSRTPGAC